LVLAGLAAGLAVLGACGPAGQGESIRAADGRGEFTAAPALGPGVEFRALVVRDSADRVAQVLAPLGERETGLSAAARGAWSASGLRVAAVPREQVGELIVALAATDEGASTDAPLVLAGQNRVWLPVSPRWMEVLREAGSAEGRSVLLGDQRVAMPPGAARVLARCWLEPVPAEGEGARALLRLELLPQWLDQSPASRPGRDGLSLEPRTISSPADDGLLLHRLAAEVALDGRTALVLVFERPGTDWAALAGPRRIEGAPGAAIRGLPAPEAEAMPEEPGAAAPSRTAPQPAAPGTVQRKPARPGDGPPSGVGDDASPAAGGSGGAGLAGGGSGAGRSLPAQAGGGAMGPALSSAQPAGPHSEVFRAATLGELLLTMPDASRPEEGRLRLVVVLIPSVPARYELLPR
jgi:hypothetical protein